MNFLGPLFYILLFTAILVYFTNKKFGESLILTFVISAFVLYISGLFGSFTYGYAILACSIAAFFIYAYIKKIDFKEFKKNYFTTSFIAFLLIYVLLYLFNIKTAFHVWDEFSHWGVMVQEMLRNNCLYSEEVSSLLAHKDYPPMLSILEMLFCKLAGGYSEISCCNALGLFNMSLFLSIFVKEKVVAKNNIKGILLTIFLTVTTAYILCNILPAGYLFRSIYIDCTIALMGAYTLFIIYKEDNLTKYNVIRLSLIFAFMLLTKQSCIAFYTLSMFYLIIKFWPKRRQLLKNIKKSIWLASMLIGVPLLSYETWSLHISALGLDKVAQFRLSSINLGEFIPIILGKAGESWQHEAASNFINRLSYDDFITRPFSLTFWQLVLLLAGVIGIIGFYYKKVISKKDTIKLSVSIIIGGIGYSLMMLLLYMYIFGSGEGVNLAEYNRYMGTYIFMIGTLIFMLLVYIWNKQGKEKNTNLNIFVVLTLLLILGNPQLIRNAMPRVISTPITQNEINANYILSKTEYESKVYILNQAEDFSTNYFTHYYMTSRYDNISYYEFLEGDGITIDKFKDIIKDYDYFFISSTNDYFNNTFGSLFDRIENRGLYRIIKENDSIRMEYIGGVDE